MDLTYIPLIALSVTLTALFFTVKNYRRKAGIFIRGSVNFGSSIYGNDRYVNSIVLENLKDRAATIFGIYVKIGHSYYIELEDFDSSPLILKPFETYQKEYGPIEFYSVNMKQINLDSLIADNSAKKSIVLSTSDGRYVVPTHLPRWHPIGDYFRNHMTAVIRPVRATFDDKDMGANTRFVIEAFYENGRKETIFIHPDDYQLVKFKKFQLTRESLQSKEALESLLQLSIDNGNLSCQRFVVHDVDKWRKDAHEHYEKTPIVAEPYNAFQYFVLGKLGTFLADRKLRLENRSLQEVNRSQRSDSARVRATDE